MLRNDMYGEHAIMLRAIVLRNNLARHSVCIEVRMYISGQERA